MDTFEKYLALSQELPKLEDARDRAKVRSDLELAAAVTGQCERFIKMGESLGIFTDKQGHAREFLREGGRKSVASAEDYRNGLRAQSSRLKHATVTEETDDAP